LSARRIADRKIGYIVPQAKALAILEEHNPEAAMWWKSHGFPRKFLSNFIFGLDEAKIISGVQMQKIIEVTDEMQGDPNR
jgi:hypothetical protein